MLFSKTHVIRTLRCRNKNMPGVLGRLTTVIGDLGAYVGEIKTVHMGSQFILRDIDVLTDTDEHLQDLLAAIQKRLADQVEILEVRDEVLDLHQDGKLMVRPIIPIETVNELRRVYTPGVADVSRLIAQDERKAERYTWASRTVAICTNGSRVLGLGNIGPLASLPVMEGKAALLCQFTDLNAVPILIDTRDPQEFVRTVLKIHKGFGAIHLEDIEVPACYEIETRLIEQLDKPVMHDDQHGTAVAALAALIAACRRTGKDPQTVSVGQVGLGAAGLAIAKQVMAYTAHSVTGTDLDENAKKRFTDAGGRLAGLDEMMRNSDVVISTTGVPGLLKPSMIREGQIVLALSNPNPEIDPDEAMAAGAALAADGRYVNNLLSYPGIWRGALDGRVRRLTEAMYTAAAIAIANLAPADELLPSPLDKRVHAAVARAVALTATQSGLARRPVDEDYMREQAEGTKK